MHGHLVSWLGAQSLPQPSTTLEFDFQNTNNSLVQMAWPCFKAQGACYVLSIVACCEIYTASFPTSNVSKTIWSAWSYGPSGKAVYLKA